VAVTAEPFGVPVPAGAGWQLPDADERLPRELAARVATCRGRYPCRGRPRLTHPLVRAHPVTGQRTLYLNERWLHGVAGCGFEEACDPRCGSMP
jgi:hypothetical protein